MSNWLTTLRLKAGYRSMRALSVDSKVDVSTLARIEHEIHVASPETLKRLVPYLKTPYIKLLAFAGHLADDPESEKAAQYYREKPDGPTSSIEDDWPEVCQALRVAENTATPEDRSRIARIIRASLGV